MKTMQFQNEDKNRLDKLLASELSYSRSQIQKAIEAGDILVNGEKTVTKYIPTENDEISFSSSAFEKEKKIEKDIPLNIIFENNDVLVLDKPAGAIVHPAASTNETTLVDAIIKKYPEIQNVGEDPQRPGIVHRLDKNVSGVIVIAKNQTAFEFLKAQFKNRKTTKIYTALVHGKMERLADTITFPIERARSGKMAAKSEAAGGKEAITHYDVIKQYPHHALLKIRIETGRTHQIRAHMLAIGHHIVGDPLYIPRKATLQNIDRIFLHAASLTITLPDGEEMIFEAALPEELNKILEEIPKI